MCLRCIKKLVNRPLVLLGFVMWLFGCFVTIFFFFFFFFQGWTIIRSYWPSCLFLHILFLCYFDVSWCLCIFYMEIKDWNENEMSFKSQRVSKVQVVTYTIFDHWKKTSLRFQVNKLMHFVFDFFFSISTDKSSGRCTGGYFNWLEFQLNKMCSNALLMCLILLAIKQSYLCLTAHNWQKWKRVFLTCPCHEIYRDEAVGLKSCKYTWKITILVKMWNLGQYRENLIFCQ